MRMCADDFADVVVGGTGVTSVAGVVCWDLLLLVVVIGVVLEVVDVVVGVCGLGFRFFLKRPLLSSLSCCILSLCCWVVIVGVEVGVGVGGGGDGSDWALGLSKLGGQFAYMSLGGCCGGRRGSGTNSRSWVSNHLARAACCRCLVVSATRAFFFFLFIFFGAG